MHKPGASDSSGPKPPRLTRGELEILAALDDLIEELNHSPTIAQIAARVGWSSRGSVHAYLERLRRRGVISGAGRSLRVEPRQGRD